MQKTVLVIGIGTGGCNIARDLERRSHNEDHPILAAYIDMNGDMIDGLVDEGVPPERTVVLGDGYGSGCNPEFASAAFVESEAQVRALMKDADVIIPIATGGKGTGTGTIVQLCKLARESGRLTFAVFVEPSLGHEVSAVQLERAISAVEELKKTTRVIHLLNSHMYRLTPDMTNTREALNEPVAQTLTSIIQVLAEGRQIDVRDMALILGGHGEQFVGHADMRSMDPSEEEIADYVRQCLDNEYLVFKHQVGLAAIAIYPGPNWPTSTRGAIAMAIRDELTRREREAYDEARKQDPSLPEEYESRYQPIVGCYPRPTDCGITVMLSQYDPNHKPLELKLPTRSRAQGMSQRLAELAASPAQPPHGGDRAFPPAGGKADFSTPREGAPTAPSHPTNGFRATWPVTVHRTTLRFSEFMDSLRHNDPSAIALAAGEVDLTKVSLPTSGVKSVVNEERFARLLADQKFSPSWRKFLLDEYLREHPVVLQRDGQIRSGPLPWKKRTLKTVEPEALAGLNEKSVGDGDRELLKLLQTVFKVWGADETRFCQAQIKASLDHSGELPAAAAAHTA